MLCIGYKPHVEKGEDRLKNLPESISNLDSTLSLVGVFLFFFFLLSNISIIIPSLDGGHQFMDAHRTGEARIIERKFGNYGPLDSPLTWVDTGILNSVICLRSFTCS